jgi:hypothetical protein
MSEELDLDAVNKPPTSLGEPLPEPTPPSVTQTPEFILYYIIGPVTELDITKIEELNGSVKENEYIIVVLQGGVDDGSKDKSNPIWASTLMAALPANAAMNPGKRFNPESKQLGWYDLLNTEKLSTLTKVRVICQTTNSAKPGLNLTDPRKKEWINLADNEFFKKDNLPVTLREIQKLIICYDKFTDAPWQHDPIAVIHSILLLLPDYFIKDTKYTDEKHKTIMEMFNQPPQEIDFTKMLEGDIIEKTTEVHPYYNEGIININSFLDTTKDKICVIPYKESFDMMNERCKLRKQLLFILLDELIKPREKYKGETKINKILCSLEIYDPDNLVALKCIESLAQTLNVKLDVYVHNQPIPTNINFIKNVISINNYKEEFKNNTIQQNIIKNIELVKNYNTLTNEPFNEKCLDLFKGNLANFKDILDINNKSQLNKYIIGFLMYSQVLDEFKNEYKYYVDEEYNFIKLLMETSEFTKNNINIFRGKKYGENGFTISAKNVLHPISMLNNNLINKYFTSKPEFKNIIDDVNNIIMNCLNTSVTYYYRKNNIISWNLIQPELLSIEEIKPKIQPKSIFHWNILDPATSNKESVFGYINVDKDETEDPQGYYIKQNNKRMEKIADRIILELKKGSIILLQEYSQLQNTILMDKIKKDPELNNINIDDHFHYHYGATNLINVTIKDYPKTNGIYVDQGLLIACTSVKFDKKNSLILPAPSKPIIYVQIGDHVYVTTHYSAAEDSDIQKTNHLDINIQINKLFNISDKLKMYFSCDMNKSVDGTPNDTKKFTKEDGTFYEFISENKTLQLLGYPNKKVETGAPPPPPYIFDNLHYIIQEDPTKVTTKPITYVIRNFGIGEDKTDPNFIEYAGKYFTYSESTIAKYNELTKQEPPATWDDPKSVGYKDNFNYEAVKCTAPAKKIDGIFTNIKGFNNKTKVYDTINEQLFLSDHYPLELDIEPNLETSINNNSIPALATIVNSPPIVTTKPPTPKPVTLSNPPSVRPGSSRGFAIPRGTKRNPQAPTKPGPRGFPTWGRRTHKPSTPLPLGKPPPLGTTIKTLGGTIKQNKINVKHSKMYNKYKITQKK